MDRFLPFIQKVPLFIQCLFSIWHDQMLSTSPTVNTPELLLLYHELKHAVLLRLTEVKTGAQEQCMCYFQRDFFKRVATSALTDFKDHLPTYLLNTYMKSSIILFTTIILFGVSEQGCMGRDKKKPGIYIASNWKQNLHVSISAPLYFSFPFKAYQRFLNHLFLRSCTSPLVKNFPLIHL